MHVPCVSVYCVVDVHHATKTNKGIQILPSLPPPQSLTQPLTAVQLHPHADVHGVVCYGHEPDKPSDDGRLQILQNNVIGIPVPLNHLQEQHVSFETSRTRISLIHSQ